MRLSSFLKECYWDSHHISTDVQRSGRRVGTDLDRRTCSAYSRGCPAEKQDIITDIIYNCQCSVIKSRLPFTQSYCCFQIPKRQRTSLLPAPRHPSLPPFYAIAYQHRKASILLWEKS